MIDPEVILAEASKLKFRQVLVLGVLDNGEIFGSGSHANAETLLLMKRAERLVVFGD